MEIREQEEKLNTVTFAEFFKIFEYRFGAIWEISNSGRTLTFIDLLRSPPKHLRNIHFEFYLFRFTSFVSEFWFPNDST